MSATPFGPKPAQASIRLRGGQGVRYDDGNAAEVKIAGARRKYVLEIGEIKLDLDRKAKCRNRQHFKRI